MFKSLFLLSIFSLMITSYAQATTCFGETFSKKQVVVRYSMVDGIENFQLTAMVDNQVAYLLEVDEQIKQLSAKGDVLLARLTNEDPEMVVLELDIFAEKSKSNRLKLIYKNEKSKKFETIKLKDIQCIFE